MKQEDGMTQQFDRDIPGRNLTKILLIPEEPGDVGVPLKPNWSSKI